MNCISNQDNAYDVDIFPEITKKSEPTNQVQTKINIVKGLQTYLNDFKNYLTTYQGFKICPVILKILGRYLYILNTVKFRKYPPPHPVYKLPRI